MVDVAPLARSSASASAARLESWNDHHPDQVRLRAFVAHVRELVDLVAKGIETPLAFRLEVGLDDSIDPLWERDMDNYLFPIARGMPPKHVSVGTPSGITIWGQFGRR